MARPFENLGSEIIPQLLQESAKRRQRVEREQTISKNMALLTNFDSGSKQQRLQAFGKLAAVGYNVPYNMVEQPDLSVIFKQRGVPEWIEPLYRKRALSEGAAIQLATQFHIKETGRQWLDEEAFNAIYKTQIGQQVFKANGINDYETYSNLVAAKNDLGGFSFGRTGGTMDAFKSFDSPQGMSVLDKVNRGANTRDLFTAGEWLWIEKNFADEESRNAFLGRKGNVKELFKLGQSFLKAEMDQLFGDLYPMRLQSWSKGETDALSPAQINWFTQNIDPTTGSIKIDALSRAGEQMNKIFAELDKEVNPDPKLVDLARAVIISGLKVDDEYLNSLLFEADVEYDDLVEYIAKATVYTEAQVRTLLRGGRVSESVKKTEGSMTRTSEKKTKPMETPQLPKLHRPGSARQ